MQRSRQQRTFIHKCLAQHCKVVVLPLTSLTGQPYALTVLIGKGTLMMQLIGLWSLSTVQFMMVKINGVWEKKLNKRKDKIKCLTCMIKSNSSEPRFWEMLFEAILYKAYSQVQLHITFLYPASHQIRTRARSTLFCNLIKHTSLHQHTPPLLSSPFGRFTKGPQCMCPTNFANMIYILEHCEEGDIWHSIKDFSNGKSRMRWQIAGY